MALKSEQIVEDDANYHERVLWAKQSAASSTAEGAFRIAW